MRSTLLSNVINDEESSVGPRCSECRAAWYSMLRHFSAPFNVRQRTVNITDIDQRPILLHHWSTTVFVTSYGGSNQHEWSISEHWTS